MIASSLVAVPLTRTGPGDLEVHLKEKTLKAFVFIRYL